MKAWKQPNGLYFIDIDDAKEKRVTLIVPAGYRVELVPANSGAKLNELKPEDADVCMPGLPEGVRASLPNAKVFECVQETAAPKLIDRRMS